MAIPKIIHYAWFSGSTMDPVYKSCLESWPGLLPGYQLRLWNASAPIDSAFFKRMIHQKKWAFAADYLRLHALYHTGGIYMDLDVRVIKSLDPLLEYTCIFGLEDAQSLACHFIAAAAHHPFIKECLDYYDSSLRLKISPPPTMPRIINRLAVKYGFVRQDIMQTLSNGILLLPAEYLSPLHYQDRLDEDPERFITGNSYCIHYWHHGWSWLDRSVNVYLKNQPWLFMKKEDWKRLLRQLMNRIL